MCICVSLPDIVDKSQTIFDEALQTTLKQCFDYFVFTRIEKQLDDLRNKIKRLEIEGKKDEAKLFQSEIDELERQVNILSDLGICEYFAA